MDCGVHFLGTGKCRRHKWKSSVPKADHLAAAAVFPNTLVVLRHLPVQGSCTQSWLAVWPVFFSCSLNYKLHAHTSAAWTVLVQACASKIRNRP